jgi:hypothetical protein
MAGSTLSEGAARSFEDAVLFDAISASGSNASTSTLGGKSSTGNTRQVWRPIKNFLHEDTEVGLDRLVGAMSMFGMEGSAGSVTPVPQLSDATDLAVAPIHMDKLRAHALEDFRTVHD